MRALPRANVCTAVGNLDYRRKCCPLEFVGGRLSLASAIVPIRSSFMLSGSLMGDFLWQFLCDVSSMVAFCNAAFWKVEEEGHLEEFFVREL